MKQSETKMNVRCSDLIGIALILVVLVAYTWATWNFFTSRFPGGNDLATHYGAWEAYLKYGLNPYSDAAVLHTQKLIYGRPALPTEDQNRMVYPFYSILVHGPFVWFDYPLARAIYMTMLQVAIFIGVLITLNLVGWRPPPWLFAVVFAWSLLDYHQARGIIIGQFAILAFFALAGTLHLLRKREDAAAGALLVLTTVKPTLVVFLIPFFLVWGIARTRRHFVAGFLATIVGLTLVSLLLQPTWIGDWVSRVTGYTEYTLNQGPVYLLTHEAVPALGTVGEVIISALLALAMLWTWWRVTRADGEREFYWALGFTLIVTNLMAPRVATTNYVLMLVPTLWLFAAMERRFKWVRIATVAIIAIALIGLWYLHIVTVRGDFEHPIMYVPWPVLLGLAWIVCRDGLVRDAVDAKVLP
jgi:hypothetical protein